MRFLLLLVCLVAGSVMAGPAPGPAQKPLNLLFILTDNQPASIIGAYGNPDVRTPNINRLAAEGMLFENAMAANGMCSPTRATLMTGLMPSQHGIHNWLDDEMLDQWPREWSAVAEFRSLPLTLVNRGYSTAMIGKWHLGQPWQASLGFQHWVTFTDGHTVDFWNNTVIENDRKYPVEGRHIVDFFTDKAVDYIRQQDGKQPFYLQLNYDGPYLNPPTNLGPARNRHYASYFGKDYPSFPRVAFNENVLNQMMDPSLGKFLRNKHRQAVLMHNDPATMANVASQNTVVDDGVGLVLDALREKGLDKNTLVVFSSDQGNFYGQHGLWQHTVVTTPGNLYEAALNIPLIVRHPGKIKAGATSDRLIGQYDIPATILDYLGIRDVAFENSPGRSFVRTLHGNDDTPVDAVFYEQEESRGIRTPEFAFWKRLRTTGEDELYDMQADPGQHRNLAGNPKYAGEIRELEARLKDFFDRYSDPRYDLWRGGVAKGSVIRPEMFQRLYGREWQPTAEILPAFSE